MAKWVRKVKHDFSAFRVAIPFVLIQDLDWWSCSFVTIEKGPDECLIIRRLPGDEKRDIAGSEHTTDVDRSTGGAG